MEFCTEVRWPRIDRFLRTEPSGRIEGNTLLWLRVNHRLSAEERATANEEWADFFEWQLAERAEELATDRIKRHLVETWTDNMAYSCRRSAAYARGEDPGPRVPSHERRPDLAEEGRVIVAAIRQGTTGNASSKMAPASSAL